MTPNHAHVGIGVRTNLQILLGQLRPRDILAREQRRIGQETLCWSAPPPSVPSTYDESSHSRRSNNDPGITHSRTTNSLTHAFTHDKLTRTSRHDTIATRVRQASLGLGQVSHVAIGNHRDRQGLPVIAVVAASVPSPSESSESHVEPKATPGTTYLTALM